MFRNRLFNPLILAGIVANKLSSRISLQMRERNIKPSFASKLKITDFWRLSSVSLSHIIIKYFYETIDRHSSDDVLPRRVWHSHMEIRKVTCSQKAIICIKHHFIFKLIQTINFILEINKIKLFLLMIKKELFLFVSLSFYESSWYLCLSKKAQLMH